MAKYRLLDYGVFDTDTNKSIPEDTNNVDWQEYQQWITDGNTPDPIATPIPPTPAESLTQTDVQMIRAIDWMLEYLVGNGTILLADVPTPLKNLYLERKAQREAVGSPQV